MDQEALIAEMVSIPGKMISLHDGAGAGTSDDEAAYSSAAFWRMAASSWPVLPPCWGVQAPSLQVKLSQ